MSNVSPRSSAPSSWGNLCACSQTCTQISAGSRRESSLAKKKPIPQQQNGSFRYRHSVLVWFGRICAKLYIKRTNPQNRYSVPDMVWSIRAKLSLVANESAKSPSPSLAGQSVIVNQAGLLAPVHRSFASSRGDSPVTASSRWRANLLPDTVA